MDNKEPTIALDGTPIDTDLYERLYNEINTYVELPLMIELATYEVVRSEFDALKEHAICYHLSGLVSIISGVKKAFKHIEDEVKILDIKLEDEMDMNDYKRYMMLKKCLEKFL